jgi:two-component sensor histidine kinase
MALVHERLYRSEDLASVDFAEYTEELTNQLFRNHVLSTDTIRLKLDFEKIPLDIDRAIPCGLILTELISNALKHAFPNGRSGEIRVSLQRTKDGGLILSVADNGVGLPDEATLQTRRSLGMRLVHSLANQFDTQIEFLRRNRGTEVRWRLETSHV